MTEGLPDAPVQPSLPSLPQLPELPRPPGLPGLSTPPCTRCPPRRPAAAGRERAPERGRTAEERSARIPGGGRPGPGGAAAHHAHHAARPSQTPAQQAPGGDPGSYGDQPAADGGVPRHGDAHAVAFGDRAPLPLMRGGTAVVTMDGTRDRHRDIPEFPGRSAPPPRAPRCAGRNRSALRPDPRVPDGSHRIPSRHSRNTSMAAGPR
ncbi:hypothetical protein E4K10_25400 [Streptomyces sp. T1317-0309]|nr:hypothetical protein E4K10_25400 [Streptomyces sp. T1317-0309]